MNPYLPIALILVLSLIVGLAMTLMSAFFGPKKSTSIKSMTFECGVPQVTPKDRMSVKFYLTSILFVLFDIETIFLYLWARAFRQLGWFGIAEIIVFMILLIGGYIYVIKSGALKWE